MRPSPPGIFKTLVLLSKVTLRRTLNHFATSFRAFSRKRRKRKPRPVRLALMIILTAVFGSLFAFQGIQLSSLCLRGLSARFLVLAAPPDGPFVISENCYGRLGGWLAKEEELRSLPSGPMADDPGEAVEEETKAGQDELAELFEAEAERILLPSRFDFAGRRVRKTPLEAREEQAVGELRDRMVAAFREKGIRGFKTARGGRPLPWPSTEMWPEEISLEMSRASAVLLTAIFVALLNLSLGFTNRDLGKAEWDLIWLSTFPIERRSLFLARVLAYAFTDLVAWLVNGTFLFTVLWSSGYRWHALWLGAAATMALNLIISSCMVVTEVLLRRYLSLRGAKAFQAVTLVIGFPMMLLVIGAGMSPFIREWCVGVTKALPNAVVWLPWALPAAVARGGAWAVPAFVLLLVLGSPAALVAAHLAERLTRGGLVRQTTVYQRPERERERPSVRWPFRGIIAKDLRFLLRDRAYMTRVLVLPILIVVFQVVINPVILSSGFSDVRRISLVIFGICAFMLFTGGLQAMNLEAQSLWLLYTFPVRLVEVMRKKALMWCGMCGVYGTVLFAVYFVKSGPALGAFLPPALSALAGVAPLSFILVGLGALGTDPEAKEAQHRISVWMVYLAFILAGLYAPVILLPRIWLKVMLYVVYCLVALLIWSILRRKLPLILDPS